jgi:hypothetical protein
MDNYQMTTLFVHKPTQGRTVNGLTKTVSLCDSGVKIRKRLCAGQVLGH